MIPSVYPRLQLVFLNYSFEICCVNNGPVTLMKGVKSLELTMAQDNHYCFRVISADESHTGVYHCKESNQHGRYFKRRAKVFVGGNSVFTNNFF